MREIKAGRHIIEISHPDKLYFPDAGITKEDVLQYYSDMSDYILPHMKERAVTMHRFPDGIESENFYQHKASDYYPDWIDTMEMKKKEGGKIKHVLCNNKASLLYLVNQGCLVPHVWLSRVSNPDYPDKILFDLDPPENDFSLVKKAALELKEEIEEILDVPSFVMSTGSSGIHVAVPLDGKSNFDSIRKTSQRIAEKLSEESPKSFTTEIRKNKRDGKLFIDTTRNAYSQTSVVPYALRALNNAPVAYPMDWEELRKNKFDPHRFKIRNILKRLSHKQDPWENFFKRKADSKELIKRINKHYN
jgi:bifunctional non-homologous end joining protein LigD